MRRQDKPIPLLTLYPLFFAFTYATHYLLLRLPYYWDEGGYYIPAALDFMRTGALVPTSTLTNAHPPVPSILLAAAWHVTGFVPSGTRTFICMIAAAALLAIYKLARTYLGESPAATVTLLTALYPIWYVQSTLAHADIFAAAFTLWALALYIPAVTRAGLAAGFSPPNSVPTESGFSPGRASTVALLFALAALSKETAIILPFALACERLVTYARTRNKQALYQLLALATTVLPLLAWYAYHHHRTGFVFGNPEYLRYNARANMDAHRVGLALYHRALHLLGHMNMYIATLLTAACFLLPRRTLSVQTPCHPERSEGSAVHSVDQDMQASPLGRPPVPLRLFALLLLTQWIAFSILGGALLTRYLLPAYPLLLILYVAVWRERTRLWPLLAAISAAAFLIALRINPPYAFAPEDNLTYRDMIVLHQQAVALIDTHFPQATVLTAWPADADLQNTFLGYTTVPIKTVSIDNFSAEQLSKAAQSPGDFDTALLFSTKYEPPAGRTLTTHPTNSDAKYFDFHRDLSPAEAARLLHGTIYWQAERNGEWAAILRFPRAYTAQLTLPTDGSHQP